MAESQNPPKGTTKEAKMKLTETMSASPLQAVQSGRQDEIRAITSTNAGEITPLFYAPLLREDRLASSRVAVGIDMAETAETLMNGVHVSVMAHFVPFLAFERFNGLDQLNRSYRKEPETEGGSVVPFIETISFTGSQPVFEKLGVHAKDLTNINSAVVEAYNALVNHRRQARSTKLPTRTKNDTTLARGFWANPGMRHIVPDFDQAMMDGEVDLQLAAASLPVRGIGTSGGAAQTTYAGSVKETGGVTSNYVNNWLGYSSTARIQMKEDPSNLGFPEIYAEMAGQGVTLSLSNIELAKKTAAFAALRKQYAGHDDEYIVDLLMEGIRVPDAQLAQPILLDRQTTMIGYSKRYATDAANLDQSVTTGATSVTLNLRTPPMNTGGIILITCEISPEQMYERQKDHYLHITDQDQYPSYTRDFLDPEKVDIVTNSHVDVEHTTPDATFGYAPLNHVWKRSIPRIGGKFLRQLGDPFDEDRQRIWSVETTDPTLTEDFYLVTDLHHNVFSDTLSDAFEITTMGALNIVGNTVFGKGLTENTDDYQQITADVDTSRIDQTA